jgi:hypothetical protein
VKLIVAIVRMIFHPFVNLGLLYSKGRAKGPNTKNKSRITPIGFKYHLTLPPSVFIELSVVSKEEIKKSLFQERLSKNPKPSFLGHVSI